MAMTSGTGAAASPWRKNKFKDAVQKVVIERKIDQEESPGTVTKKKNFKFTDVVEQVLERKKRDPEDRRRIILSHARHLLIQSSVPAYDALDEPEWPTSQLETAAVPPRCRKIGRARLQVVVESARVYLLGLNTALAFKDSVLQGRCATTFGVLLKEDASKHKLQTTLESLTDKADPTSSSAQKLLAMSAKLKEIMEMQDHCSALVNYVRLIPTEMSEVYTKMASNPESTKAIEDELEASGAILRRLGLLLGSLEREYDWFRDTFMSFQPTVLPVCWAGHTMTSTEVPRDETVVCEQCHAPSRTLSKHQDLACTKDSDKLWVRNFQFMWHCEAPNCHEKFPYYLCKPCGKAKSRGCGRWLSCLSSPLEWETVKEDASNAIADVKDFSSTQRQQDDASNAIADVNHFLSTQIQQDEEKEQEDQVAEEDDAKEEDAAKVRRTCTQPDLSSRTCPLSPAGAKVSHRSATLQEARRPSTQSELPSYAGHSARLSQISLILQPALPKSGQRNVQVEVDARSKLASTPRSSRRSSKTETDHPHTPVLVAHRVETDPLPHLELPVFEPRRPSKSLRPRQLGSQRERKESKDSLSTPRRSSVDQQLEHLVQARASAQNGTMTRHESEPRKQASRTPGSCFKSMDQWSEEALILHDRKLWREYGKNLCLPGG